MGCAEGPRVVTRVERVVPDFPPQLFVCAAWPTPDDTPRDAFGLARWLAQSKAAWLDCSHRLACAGAVIASEGACGTGSAETP